MSIDEDIAEVLAKHHPGPPVTADQLAAWERENGIRLDAELRKFYLAANGASLFRQVDSPYRILPLEEIVPGRVAIFGPRPPGPEERGRIRECPANVFAFVDVQDGNYAGFEASPREPYPVVDIFHETWPKEQDIIALSFGEFLRGALDSAGQGLFWIQD